MVALAADLGVRRTGAVPVNGSTLTLLAPRVLSAALALASSGDHTAVLVAPPAAREVARKEEKGVDTLTYRMTEAYPAPATLSFIRSAVEAKGWMPLKDDFLNPGLPSSHVRGWGTVIDGTVTPNQTLHSWHAQWTNKHGDILVYHLDYHCALEDRRHSDEVVVSAAFLPKAVYERAKTKSARNR